jgi:hypothetical protein
MMQKRFDQLTTELAALKTQIENGKAELQARGAEHRTQAGPITGSAPTPRKPSENPADSRRPYYFTLGKEVVVISPDGSKAAVHDPQSGKSRIVRFPEMVGARRVFLPGMPLANGSTREISAAVGHWFPAVELDGDRKVVRLLAIDVRDGSVSEVELSRPLADHSLVRSPRPGVIQLGQDLYVFSAATRRWCPLLGITGNLRFGQDALWAPKDGRLFRFNQTTGEWDDIYARAIEGRQAGDAIGNPETPSP